MIMRCLTCLYLHNTADFTVTTVSIRSYGEFIGFPTVQVGEPTGGVGGVALPNYSQAAGGISQVELHSLTLLPV